jgi:curli production assembly/transport component CsgF
MVYSPINPSFGGNSFNSAHLLGLANAQNEPKTKAEREKGAAAKLSNSDRFIQMLQSRLYSTLAGLVSEAIFGDGARPTGTMTLQDQRVSWENTGTEIRLTLVDLRTGTITELVVPTLIQ